MQRRMLCGMVHRHGDQSSLEVKLRAGEPVGERRHDETPRPLCWPLLGAAPQDIETLDATSPGECEKMRASIRVERDAAMLVAQFDNRHRYKPSKPGR